MTEPSRDLTPDEVALAQRLRAPRHTRAAEPSSAHDAQILGTARAAAESIQRRSSVRQRHRLWIPASLAASLVVGVLIGRWSWMLSGTWPHASRLTVPAVVSERGAGGAADSAAVPVEQLDPAVWYRYIQELVFAGQTELAERHLRRFRELHPDFVYQP